MFNELMVSGMIFLEDDFFLNFVGHKAKGHISRRLFQENQVCQILRKANISYPLIRAPTFAYQGGKRCSFFEKFDMLCFLVTPV